MSKQLEDHELRLENTQASEMAQRVKVLAATKSEEKLNSGKVAF